MRVHHAGGEAARAGPGAGQPQEPAPPPSRPNVLDALARRVPRRWWLPLATYAVCQAIFLVWWAALYPGLMDWDSVTYVLHVTTGPWVNNHSVLYDSLVWLSLHVSGDLAVLTLAQTVATSAALAYTVAAFRRLGAPGRWTALAAVVVAALPPTGTFIVFVWKDVPFTICAFLVVPTVAHLVSLRGQPGWPAQRRVRWLVAAIGAELLGVCLFRLNGFLVVVLAAVALVLLLPGVRARMTMAAVGALCLTFVLNLAVFPAVGIQKAPTLLSFGTSYGDIAVAYARRPASFTAADTRLMAQVMPLADWTASANCYDVDQTIYRHGFSVGAAKVSSQLVSLWLRVLKRSPDLVLGARLCRGSIAWVVFPGSRAARANPYPSKISADLWGKANLVDVRDNPYRADFATRPLSYSLNKLTVTLRAKSEAPGFAWLLWRGATWCYLAYLMVWVIARRRRDWSVLALAAIVAAQQIAVMLDNPAQLFRYMVSPIFIGVMLVPLVFARRQPARPGQVDRGAFAAAAGEPATPA